MDINNKLYRIQSKHCTPMLKDGMLVAIKFKTVRQSGSNSKTYTRTKYTKDEIDFFSTFYDGECYLVPVEECSTQKYLRQKTPKNNQIKGVSFMENYKIQEVVKHL